MLPLKDFFFNLSNLQKNICIHCSGRYERTSSTTQHNALLTFENRGFQRAGDEYVTINSMYDAGNDDYDEPNKGHWPTKTNINPNALNIIIFIWLILYNLLLNHFFKCDMQGKVIQLHFYRYTFLLIKNEEENISNFHFSIESWFFKKIYFHVATVCVNKWGKSCYEWLHIAPGERLYH